MYKYKNIMVRIKSEYVDEFGALLLIFSVVFSFFYSFGYTLDGSNVDYLFYMRLTEEGDYSQNPLFVGTLLLYKPLCSLFGHNYWLWQRFHWFFNLLTICIPYFSLLNSKQRKQFAFVQALAVLLFCISRCGCEPPRLVLPFAIIAVCLFIKYTKSKDFRHIVAISLLLSLIAFVRFPSLFVYPLFVFAIILLHSKVRDKVGIVFLPLVLFSFLVSFTNESPLSYFHDLKIHFADMSTASPGHSISAIFYSEVKSVIELVYFSFISIIPFLLLLWKKKSKIWLGISLIVVLLVMNIIRINPIPRWACAIAIVLGLFYMVEHKYSRQSLSISFLSVLVPLITSVGSDCGFGYDYVAVTFLPYFAANMQSVVKRNEYYYCSSINCSFNKGLLFPAFFLVITMLYCSNFIVRIKNVRDAYFLDGSVSIVNAECLSPNMRNTYFSEKNIARYLEAESDYKQLSNEGRNVIFWGMDAHLMSFSNNKWPVTHLWRISSKDGENAAMSDLETYIKIEKPIVIDMQKDANTCDLLTSFGYQKVEKKYYLIYK